MINPSIFLPRTGTQNKEDMPDVQNPKNLAGSNFSRPAWRGFVYHPTLDAPSNLRCYTHIRCTSNLTI
jgi:hypothetical protein